MAGREFCTVFAIFVTAFVQLPASVFLAPQAGHSECGFLHCNKWKKDALNVHLVPLYRHPNFLKTEHSLKDYLDSGHQQIVESYIAELVKDPTRRFLETELTLFSRRLKSSNEIDQAAVKTLVENGQLEFGTGSLTSSDEVTSTYIDLLDSLSSGHRFLESTFGKCSVPKSAWQQEQFGHSSAQASIFANSGFNGLFVSNINQRAYNRRYFHKTLESLWQTSQPIGKTSQIFTSVLFGNDGFTEGFCFDLSKCNNSLVDNKIYSAIDQRTRAEKFIQWIQFQRNASRSGHLLIPMVADFHLKPAQEWFQDIDSFIKLMNSATDDMYLLYSTPSCYLNAVHEDDLKWPQSPKDDFEFLPRSSEDVGRYVTRSKLKRTHRELSSKLQAGKQWAAISRFDSLTKHLQFLRDAVALSLQHTVLTGSSSIEAIAGFQRTFENADRAFDDMFSFSADSVLGTRTGSSSTHVFCEQKLTEMKCQLTEQITSGYFVVTVYNPSPRSQSYLVTFPTPKGKPQNYLVTSPEGTKLAVDVVPEPSLGAGTGQYRANFMAAELAPLSFTSFHVSVLPEDENNRPKQELSADATSDLVFENHFYTLTMDASRGSIKSLARKDSPHVRIHLRQDFLVYTQQNNPQLSKHTFLPDNEIANLLSDSTKVTFIRGDVLTEIRIRAADKAMHILRLFPGSDAIESHWLLDTTKIKFTTDLKSNFAFYTDSNGKHSVKRILNYRGSHKNISRFGEDVYPVTSWAFLRDDLISGLPRQFTVITDRTQAASSFRNGELEFMLYWPRDKEESPTGDSLLHGVHKFVLDSDVKSESSYKTEALSTSRAPILSFRPEESSASDWMVRGTTKMSLLKKPLPENVVLTSIEPWAQDSLLLRLEHLLENKQNSDKSGQTAQARVDIMELIQPAPKSVKETYLTGTYYRVPALTWKPETGEEIQLPPHEEHENTGIITLNPGEIRASPFPSEVNCSVTGRELASSTTNDTHDTSPRPRGHHFMTPDP
ncbi:unnamed protein product [Notodromas monacha]|uniref:Alpha-mannosidase n=1 Tax=Notodromas monacha TaxID=399045 RepID=A0A7R9BQK6_9CRUS|nr:unnamed protein product [Notodromas monacha]CAG0918358.1 unnamed protein product [Notodromas monacha]